MSAVPPLRPPRRPSRPDRPARPPLRLGRALGLALGWALVSAPAPAAPALPPSPPLAARPLPLDAVRLTGGPLKNAQDLTGRTLLALDVDRLLAGFRLRAGLPTNAPGYGGWDSPEGKQLTGHLAGHALSGLSLMYAATGDPRFLERANALVRGLAEVQARRGTGYLGAITDAQGTDGEQVFRRIAAGDIRSGGFDLNGMWSPWYTLHKVYAGLRDAWRHTGNRTALEIEVRFAEWARSVTSGLSEDQRQRMLHTEFGGMNEVFVDLATDTGDPRWLELSRHFEHLAVTLPLQRHQDLLAGQHGNTQVPKLIGSLARYAATGEPADGIAAAFFWDRVVQHHSYATGGHGKDEYFGEPDRLHDRVDGRTAETCNVYNMLKLTRTLFALRPDPFYADFHERALFNHILASLEPVHGWACYMVPVGRGVEREYERAMLDGGFTCCTASSLESHALHGHGLYFESADRLWVNLYVPSRATWRATGATLVMDTDLPEGDSATLTLRLPEPREFTLSLRRPAWVDSGFTATLNGEPLPTPDPGPAASNPPARPPAVPPAGSTLDLRRTWKDGDRIHLVLPKSLRLEPLPDAPQRAALLWGPLVLAGDLGPDEEDGRPPETTPTSPAAPRIPVLVAAGRPVAEWLKPVPDRPGTFRTQGVGRDRDVEFSPFYQLHRRTYAVYWDLFTPSEWEREAARLAAEDSRRRRLEQATVGFVQPGEMQAERDARQQGESTSPVRLMGRAGRRGSKWFSFDLKVDPAHPLALVATYNRDEWQERNFDVLVDGTRVGRQHLPRRGPVEFFDVEYPVPPETVQGKARVTVRFEAAPGSEVGAVYGLRIVRRDLER